LTVSVAELELTNWVPVVVCPAIVTAYAVGDEAEIEAGIRKPTILVEAITVPTLDAVVVTGLPPVGVSVTVTAEGEIVPLG
jgi:hypothetical protein